jgi:putative glutathione S-transferase
LAALPDTRRFDVAYFSIFKCNKKRIAGYPSLSNYIRDLHSVPGMAATTKLGYYVINYYLIFKLNPNRLIPKGTPVDLGQPHDRARIAA